MGEYSIFVLVGDVILLIFSIYLLFFYKKNKNKLFHFRESITVDSAIKKMEKQGFRPATDEELVEAVKGEKIKIIKKREKGYIIALGSIEKHESEEKTPAVKIEGGRRLWVPVDHQEEWGTDYSFLGIRN